MTRLRRRPARRTLAAIALAVLLLPGCATTLGSKTVRPTSADYAEAIARAWNEQMLLNLVRLRYRDTPQFLEVSSVLTQYSFEGGVNASAAFGFSGGDNEAGGISGGIEYSERPTITWLPLQGREFAERFLSPISAATIVLLSQSGWSVERLMLCCVAQVNGLRNSPSAAGPTPDYVPDFAGYQRIGEVMRTLQVVGVADVALREVGEKQDMILAFRPMDPENQALLDELRRMLGLRDGATEFTLTTMRADREPDEIMITGRSLMGVLFFLSQAVEVPAEHAAAGLVTVTRRPEGEEFDWSEITGRLIRIRSSASDPGEMAFIKARHRGHWFYIEDRDLNSKKTFGLVRYLFSLQATAGGKTPLLTVSTGG